MKTFLRLSLALALGLSLLGCQSTGWQMPGASSPDSDALLQYATQLRQLKPKDLIRENERLQKQYATTHSEESRLRLALLLSVSGETSRAISLLDPAAGNNKRAVHTHPLAQLLLPMLQEIQQLENTRNAQQLKLRELQHNHDDMRQKLEALREIELNLQARPKNR